MKKKTGPGKFSLRPKGLAQARGVSRSGGLLSPRQELEKGNSGDVAFFP